MKSVIAYTDRLWKSLERPPRTRRQVGTAVGGQLAPWVATLTRYDGRSYVIAVAPGSGLSLVFETLSLERFKPAMIAALTALFEDLRLPTDALPAEAADIDSAAFVRQRDPIVRGELEFIEGICGTEFPYFPDNLRRVQLNLNELPRPRQTPSVPREAAPLLFGSGLRSTLVQ